MADFMVFRNPVFDAQGKMAAIKLTQAGNLFCKIFQSLHVNIGDICRFRLPKSILQLVAYAGFSSKKARNKFG